MKTYTIKPLVWRKTRRGEQAGYFTVWQRGDKKGCMWEHYEGFNRKYGETDTIEAAKAKAQELHEQELLKYLEPTE